MQRTDGPTVSAQAVALRVTAAGNSDHDIGAEVKIWSTTVRGR